MSIFIRIQNQNVTQRKFILKIETNWVRINFFQQLIVLRS